MPSELVSEIERAFIQLLESLPGFHSEHGHLGRDRTHDSFLVEVDVFVVLEYVSLHRHLARAPEHGHASANLHPRPHGQR